MPDRNAMVDASSRAVRARTHVRGVAGQAGSEERRAAGVQVVNVEYRNDRYTGSSYGLDNVGRRPRRAHRNPHDSQSRIVVAQPARAAAHSSTKWPEFLQRAAQHQAARGGLRLHPGSG